MRDSLIEIKNNLQGNNSRVEEAENHINDVEHKEAKNNHTEQQEEKKIQETRTVQAACGTTLSNPTFASWGARRRRERARDWKSI